MADIPNYYKCRPTKKDYKLLVTEVLERPKKEGKCEKVPAVARRFGAQQNTLIQSIFRQNCRIGNSRGMFNKNGNIKMILSEAQEEVIQLYCFEQWELGLGASHQEAFGAISNLLQANII